jgi:hypothetical protein
MILKMIIERVSHGFKILTTYLPAEIDKNHKKPQLGFPGAWASFEMGTSLK